MEPNIQLLLKSQVEDYSSSFIWTPIINDFIQELLASAKNLLLVLTF